MEASAPAISVPAVAFSCPRCREPAPPSDAGGSSGVRTCAQCAKDFLLVAGASGHDGVTPYDPREHRPGFKVKEQGMFVMHQVELEPTGFAWGALDPFIGVARMESTRVQFPQVVSFAVWRSPNWLRLAWNSLIGVPLTVSLTVGAITESVVWLVLLVPIALLTGFGLYASLSPGVLRFRIVSTLGEKEVKLRRGGRKAKRFALEAVRRVTSTPPKQLP